MDISAHLLVAPQVWPALLMQGKPHESSERSSTNSACWFTGQNHVPPCVLSCTQFASSRLTATGGLYNQCQWRVGHWSSYLRPCRQCLSSTAHQSVQGLRERDL